MTSEQKYITGTAQDLAQHMGVKYLTAWHLLNFLVLRRKAIVLPSPHSGGRGRRAVLYRVPVGEIRLSVIDKGS